jgi:hypothetical protein
MTPSGIEPATFRFVAQYLNHCATISGPNITWMGGKYNYLEKLSNVDELLVLFNLRDQLQRD